MKMIRVLIYEGDEDWISQCVKSRGIKESTVISQGSITEAFIGFDSTMFESFIQKIFKKGQNSAVGRG